MSVWAEISGTICIPRDQHFSIRTLAEEIFDEFTFSSVPTGTSWQNIVISFSDDDTYARILAEQFIAALKGIKGSHLDLTVSVRYLK